MMATLYVVEQGARLEKRYQTLEVIKHDQRLMRVPLNEVTAVVLVGNVGVTTPAMQTLLRNGVSLALMTRSGKMLGWLHAASKLNLPLRHNQFEHASDPEFCLALGRAVVEGKLRNSRAMARRIIHAQGGDGSALAMIRRALADVSTVGDLATLRGVEGSAAKVYFSVLRSALPDELTLEKRTRRPPKDPVNALLSFGYSLLTANLMAAAEIAGLDPYDGFFHADKYGRPALALDLVEEFRPIIVDSVVLSLINNRRIGRADFVEDGAGGFYLTQRGLKRFLNAYTQRLYTEVFHPDAGRALSYLKVFEVQARRLRKVIEGELPEYRPFVVR